MAKPKKLPPKLAKYASEFASLGGQARMRKLSEERRKDIAKQAAKARWAKKPSKKTM